jgi:hypothetical protein
MKTFLTAVILLFTLTACQKKVTLLFEGLMVYIDDTDGSVWVILPDARDPVNDATGHIPAHLPMVFFSGPDGQVENEIPWILDLEEIHIDSELTGAVNVDSAVWDGLASMSALSGGANQLHPSLKDAAQTPYQSVARLHLKGGKLTVDPRDEATYDAQVDFKTLANEPHPGPYTTPNAALLLRWEAEVESITFRATQFATGNQTHYYEPPMNEVRGYIGNLPVYGGHGLTGTDEHFGDFYSLMTSAVPKLYLPQFNPGGIVGSRVCMGGRP